MRNKLKEKIIDGVTWNIIKVCIQVINGLITSLLLAKILIDPKSYGEYSYFLMIGNICSTIGLYGYSIPILQILGEEIDEEKAINKAVYFIKKCSLNFIISLPCLIVIICVLASKNIIPLHTIYSLVVVIILCLAMWLLNIINTIFMGLKEFRYSNIISIAVSCIFSLFQVIIFINKVKVTASAMNLIFAIITILITVTASCMFFIHYKKDIDLTFKLNKSRYQRKAKCVFFIQLCDIIVWDKSEIFFLGRYGLINSLGLYSFAYQITNSISNVIQGVYSNLCIPIFSEVVKEDSEKAKSLFYNMVKFAVGTTTIIYMVTFLLLGFVVRIWLEKYLFALPVLYILFIGKILSSTGAVAAAAIHVNNKSKLSVYTSYITAAVNLILDIILIKRYGHIGAAVANTISQLIGMTLGIFVIVKYVKYTYPIVDTSIYLLAYILFAFLHCKGVIYYRIIILLIVIINYVIKNRFILTKLLSNVLVKLNLVKGDA